MMIFEEYWNSLANDPADSELLVMQCRFAAESAWYAATDIEREACAKVCEEFEDDMGHGNAQKCADAIRARTKAKIP